MNPVRLHLISNYWLTPESQDLLQVAYQLTVVLWSLMG